MVALPIIAAVISAVFAAVIAHDSYRRPRPDKISWVIAFGIFTIAAGAEVVGDLYEWTPLVARVFYLTGAVLVTLFLGVGELYLLFGQKIKRFAPGVTLAVVALAISLVWSAPIDEARLATDKWEAIEREGALIALVAISNAFGVVVLAGGALYSAWRFWRSGTHRHRMIGCLLIALGTMVIASKGYAERLGLSVSDDMFYAFLAAGAAIIFLGYLETRRPDRVRVSPASEPATASVALATPPPSGAATSANGAPTTNAARSGQPPAPEPAVAPVAADPERSPRDEGIAFIEARFLTLDDAALDALATAWSASRRAGATLTREQAREVWALRRRLTPAGQEAFDRLPVAALLQLADLYFGVLAPEAHEDEPRSASGGGHESPSSWDLTTIMR